MCIEVSYLFVVLRDTTSPMSTTPVGTGQLLVGEKFRPSVYKPAIVISLNWSNVVDIHLTRVIIAYAKRTAPALCHVRHTSCKGYHCICKENSSCIVPCKTYILQGLSLHMQREQLLHCAMQNIHLARVIIAYAKRTAPALCHANATIIIVIICLTTGDVYWILSYMIAFVFLGILFLYYSVM